jgi:alpha-L-fucosidase
MRKSLTILFLFAILFPLRGQMTSEALQQWKNDKYSMFIHWGIYSELGGVWDGNRISRGYSEQIQAHAGIYSDEYERVAKRFNPEKWNPDSVVLLAKQAGMRSIVITSKHHDGFCMFHSNYTDYNVVDATPYKRDVIKELSEACARHGVNLGLYFSLIDWHYPQAAPISSHNSDFITPEHFEFNKNQIRELLTNYGPVSELWFDMGSHSFEQSAEMRQLVHSLQPGCMIGSRLGNDMNDFLVMGDNQEPDYIISAPWQSPASFFHETWGYRSWQERGNEPDKVREKLTSLICVVSRGGNYLLNIGPRGDGTVVEFERQVLLDIGKWLKKNSEAIYGAQADPFHVAFDWGAITSRKDKLYLHILSKPRDGVIRLPGMEGVIRTVTVLENEEPCTFKQTTDGITIQMPTSIHPEQAFKVIKIVFNGDYKTPPCNPVPFEKNTTLNQHNAFKYYSFSGIDYSAGYRSTTREEWTVVPGKNGQYTPVLYYTGQEKGRSIDLQLNGQSIRVGLEHGTPVKLANNMDGLTWGPIYRQGPFTYASIDRAQGAIGQVIDPGQPWGALNRAWEQTGWKNNEIYTLPGDRWNDWCFLQEITSLRDRQILVSVTSADGVMVLLNGQTLVVHNNPFKKENMQDIVLLNLKKGKNQLFVKCFSHFQKEAHVGIGWQGVDQQLYVEKLAPVQFRKNEYFPVSWKLSDPVTPHETLNLPNLSLKFE